jgi:hypothetical protein
MLIKCNLVWLKKWRGNSSAPDRSWLTIASGWRFRQRRFHARFYPIAALIIRAGFGGFHDLETADLPTPKLGAVAPHDSLVRNSSCALKERCSAVQIVGFIILP